MDQKTQIPIKVNEEAQTITFEVPINAFMQCSKKHWAKLKETIKHYLYANGNIKIKAIEKKNEIDT